MAGWGVVDDLLGAVNLIDWVEGLIRGAMAGDVVGHRIALPTRNLPIGKQTSFSRGH